jgi:hypothetical protein
MNRSMGRWLLGTSLSFLTAMAASAQDIPAEVTEGGIEDIVVTSNAIRSPIPKR